MGMNQLEELRDEAASMAFENYDFAHVVVEDASGWEWDGSTPNEISRVVFFANPEHQDSIKGHFVIRFAEGSAEIEEAYAHIDGREFGSLPSLAPAPAA